MLWAELVGLAVVAITQPVLDTLGRTPEQFVFRGASARDIVVLVLAVAFVPATVVWLPGMLVRRFDARPGWLLHVASVALAVFFGAAQMLGAIDLTGYGKTGAAVVAAAAGVALYVKFVAARIWAQFMAAFAPIFVGLFLFASPAGDLVFADPPEVVQLEEATALEPEAAATGNEAAAPERFPDIVMIVLDELPTSLLLDESGAIDDARYPALAEFADDATWYRNYTTVSSQTVKAIPAILSGQMPVAEDLGVWTQRPDTLFRLLGGTYHLTVSEALTRFCPEDWCGLSPVPPPAPRDAEASDGAVPTTSSPRDLRGDTGFRRGGLSELVGDAVDVWTAQVAQDRDDTPVLSGFEEATLDPATTTTAPPTTAPSMTTQSPTRAAPTADDAAVSEVEEEVALEFLEFQNELVTQLPRIDDFRAAVTPSDQPTLYFLHVVLPHQPFMFTEDGGLYSGPSVGADWRGEWDVVLDTERFSMQMQFTDALIGGVLDQARGAGVYDDAMVIVMADHGASVGTSTEYRWYDGTNAADLMLTPLLIKAPRQRAGSISDARFQAIDVLPTIAESLDIDLPWPTDGRAVDATGPGEVDDCTEPLSFVRFGRGRITEADLVEHFEFCSADLAAELEPTLTDRRPTDVWAVAPVARRTPYPELLGRTWAELDATVSTGHFALDDADQVVGGASPALGVIQGAVDRDIDAEWVAVAIGDHVAGISPLYTRPTDAGGPNRFAIVVPSPLLSEEGYEIRVATLDTDGDGDGDGSEVIATELVAE